jgi:hypothetical protein
MTITALQKRCDQDDLAVNTTNTFRGDAIGGSLSTRSLRLSPSQTQRGNAAYTIKLPLE